MIKINGCKLEETIYKHILEKVSVSQKSNPKRWNLLYYPVPMGFANKIKFWYMHLKE